MSTPDLDRHCERVIRSAHALGLQPTKTAEEILALALEGVGALPARHGTLHPADVLGRDGAHPDRPSSTQFALVITKMPLPDPSKGFTACLSPYRRPGPDQAPTHAKAACLYPLAAMAAADAKRRGFDNAVMRDPIGNVAEFTAQNIMIVQRRRRPHADAERDVSQRHHAAACDHAAARGRRRGGGADDYSVRTGGGADEIFATGNHGKVVPCLRYEDTTFAAGPMAAKARELYWAFAHGRSVPPARRADGSPCRTASQPGDGSHRRPVTRGR